MGGQRRGKAVERKKFTTAVDMAKELPHLFKPISDSPTLIGEEQDSLAQCEAAVETLKGAFWAAGKALQIIRDARLYRETHKTFDDYCDERWSMNRQYADKLIRAWPIAEALYKKQDPANLTPIGVKKLNQAQVWELVPVAESWDVDTATFVYDTVVEIDGQAVTAAVLKGAVKSLPKGDEFDREVAAERILEYVSSLSQPPVEKVPAPAPPIEDQIAVRADRAVQADWVRRLAAQDRRRATDYLDQVQQRLDKLRKELLTSSA
ncbi:hypothetical protein [Streptomyces sp. BE133]|uniref:hypothetical protein n=1 Tax=Streptomyces sp. BE133 TaxID=3002523 RepID=UPI002E7A1D39|nr:hypothetical protein [Streptomyces sp. BE133]MEE1812669.1 hypothetical protein [Streptomyces sp. BE133]